MLHEKKCCLPLASLVEDMSIYPRHAIDGMHVASLVSALEVGNDLPPIRIDGKSKRITDGWHRRRARLRLAGNDGAQKTECIAVDYGSEAEMIADAVRCNAIHGRRLDALDRTRCILMLRSVGLNDAQISQTIMIPEAKIEKLVVRVAEAPKGTGLAVPGTQMIVLKQAAAHLAGEKMTKGQVEAHGMMPGTSLVLVARQLGEALRHDLIDWENERLIEALRELRDLLTAKVK